MSSGLCSTLYDETLVNEIEIVPICCIVEIDKKPNLLILKKLIMGAFYRIRL